MASSAILNLTNEENLVSENIFITQDRIIASVIIVAIGTIGLIFHLTALNLIRKIKELHNIFGYLCVTNSICAIVLMLLFIFYCVPVTLMFYAEISEYWTHRIGQTLLFFYFVTLYTHVGTAINRYIAVCMPLQYRKNTSSIVPFISICLVWLAGFIHVVALFFGVQSFYFHNDSLLFYYGDDDFSQAMAKYIDFIYSCSIMGLVFLLDCFTLANLRHLLKAHNVNTGNNRNTERHNIKREVIFFIQAFLNMASFVVMLFFFHLVYRLLSDSKWGSFFTTTFAWELMHAFDGVVLTTFSYMFSKKKRVGSFKTQVISITKALKIASELGIEEFKASAGFIEKFKARQLLNFKTMHDEAIGINEIRREIDISLNIRNYLGIDDHLSTAEMEIDETESSHTELEPVPLHAEMESITFYFMEYNLLLDDGILPEEQSEYDLNNSWWDIYD